MSAEPQPTVVDHLYEQFAAIIKILDDKMELSLRSTAEDCFRKILLLAAASHFEKSLTCALEEWVRTATRGDKRVMEFFKQKALRRQYHSLFDWDKSNANKFFGLFGEDFKAEVQAQLRANDEFDASVRAFLEVGSERNKLIHNDLGNFPLDKTTHEIFKLYATARSFSEQVPALLAPPHSEGEH